MLAALLCPKSCAGEQAVVAEQVAQRQHGECAAIAFKRFLCRIQPDRGETILQVAQTAFLDDAGLEHGVGAGLHLVRVGH